MKSLNMMLVFAAVGTGYSAAPDTRADTTCATMPATMEECAGLKIEGATYDADFGPGGSHEDKSDEGRLLMPYGCITMPASSTGTKFLFWNDFHPVDAKCSAKLRVTTGFRSFDDFTYGCACVALLPVADTRADTPCATMPATENDCKTQAPEDTIFLPSLGGFGQDKNGPEGCSTWEFFGITHRLWNAKGTGSCQGTSRGCVCVEDKAAATDSASSITSATVTPKSEVVDEEWLRPSPSPPTPVSPGTEVVFHKDMFTTQCNPKLCASWSCVDWCHCFDSNPLVEQMFDSVAYGTTLAGLCPSDATPCEC